MMAIPTRHVENLEELSAKESEELFRLSKLCVLALKNTLKPDGFNIGANIGSSAGAGVRHFHFHTVPRWVGDTNYMPILANTRVLSESLDTVWSTIREEIGRH
jgi:ATP adenylyltransferase